MNALRWVGYKEHLTPAKLTTFGENAGKGGCTIFADMVKRREGVDLMGLPWCATFVFAVIGRPDILGRAVPGTRVLAKRMQARGWWRGRECEPACGDLVFCSNDGRRISHVGIVINADDSTVTSVDGNTHDPDGGFAWDEGGVVAVNRRPRTSHQIKGYAAIGSLWM